MRERRIRIEAAGIFIAVEMGLERPVKPVKKRVNMAAVGIKGRTPALRVMLVKRPEHDVTALINHPVIGALQNRNRGLVRNRQKRRRFVAQQNFAQFKRNTGSGNGKARPHRIGATAKTPEDWQRRFLAHGRGLVIRWA